MRYRRPFTVEQRNDAVRKYYSFRRSVRLLRRVYAPATAEQKAMLRDYRAAVHAFGLELSLPRRDVDVSLLNRLDEMAASTYVEYLASKMKGAGSA